MHSGQIQAVRYNGSLAHAHTLQHWVNTGMYHATADNNTDLACFRLYLPDGTSQYIQPHTIIIAEQQHPKTQYRFMHMDEFKHYYTDMLHAPIPVSDYLNLYFNMQDRQAVYQPSYLIGTILHSANSRKYGNAIITHIHKDTYRILSDIGAELWLTLAQIEQHYLKPISAYSALTEHIPAYRKAHTDLSR